MKPTMASDFEARTPRPPTPEPTTASDFEARTPRPTTPEPTTASDFEARTPRPPTPEPTSTSDFEARTPRPPTPEPTTPADFEARYRADPDPWRTLTDPYESHKRERTLAACGPGPFRVACDLGAGTGVLAAALAPRCGRLLALDGAPTAVAEAQRRLTPFPHAEARVATLPDGLPAGPLDLVVASEILYYLDDDPFHMVLDWLPNALTPGGRAVAVHWTGTAPDLRRSADEVGAALAMLPSMRTVEDGAGSTEGFRLDVLERAR